MNYSFEINQLNDLLRQIQEEIKMPFLLETGWSFDSVLLKDLSVKFHQGEYGHEDITIITHTFEVIIDDDAKSVETIKMDSLHYECYSIEYEEMAYETDNYRIIFREEEIDFSYYPSTELIENFTQFLVKGKYVEAMHDSLYLTWDIVKKYAQHQEEELKRRILKWYPFFTDIQYDGNKLITAYVNNGTSLRLDYNNLLGEVMKLERKEKSK